MSTTQQPASRPASLTATSGGTSPVSVPRLMGVEWLRLRSRRAFWALVAAAFIGMAVTLGSLARDARPPSASEIAAAEQQAAADAQQPFVQEEIERCRDAAASGDESMYGPDFDCDQLIPRAENYYYQDLVELVPRLGSLFQQLVATFGLAAVLIGATFTGADWGAGTIGTQLVFEPRRGRLFAAKAIVVALAVAVVAAVGAALVATVVYAIASAWGSTAGAADATGDLVLTAVRAVATVAVAGAAGVALGMALRRSVAVLGVLAAYAFLGEGLLRGLSQGIEPWLISTRLLGWLTDGGLDLEQYPDSCAFGPCEPTVTHISTAAGGAYLLAGAALLVLGSYVVFRRRDVG